MVGTVVGCPEPLLAAAVGYAFDFVWLDQEHSALSVRDVALLVVASQAEGCGVLVRIASADSEDLTALLDLGVDGIVVPRVESAEHAERVVRRLRYPPAGTRGFALRRGAGWGRSSPSDDIVAMIQIESRGALEEAAAIAALPGVDALVVGTADLALELGVPPDVTDATVRSAIAATRRAAAGANAAFGIAGGGDPAALAEALGAHGSMIVYSADVRLYAEALDRAAEAGIGAIAGRSVGGVST